MAKYKCPVCGYVYIEENEGNQWSQLPDDWICLVCRAEKRVFVKSEDDNANYTSPVFESKNKEIRGLRILGICDKKDIY